MRHGTAQQHARNGVFGMKAWGITHKGAVREENQDAFYLALPSENLALGVVCDGMGGARGGNVASRMAVECFSEQMLSSLRPGLEEGTLKEMLTRAAEIANGALYMRSQEDPALSGMGTTLVAAVAESSRALILNVGDSPALQTIILLWKIWSSEEKSQESRRAFIRRNTSSPVRWAQKRPSYAMFSQRR